MRILLNASTLNKGGALQAAANFIIESLRDPSIAWHYAVSTTLFDEIANIQPGIRADERFTLFETSPAKSLAARKQLTRTASAVAPDLVFTFFGPAYVEFAHPHLLGFAEPWVTHPNRHAYNALKSWKARLSAQLSSRYKRSWLKHADQWVVEAEVAQKGIMAITGRSAAEIHIVKNGCRDVFHRIEPATWDETSGATPGNPVRALYLSAYYPHKNHEFIPDVALYLKNNFPRRHVKFVLSLNEADGAASGLVEKIRALGVSDYFDFIGGISLKDAPSVYAMSHMAFVPTLLEAFSATYPEAMACGIPIVTTDMDFSRFICRDAAAYFPPNDVETAARAIVRIIEDETYRKSLVSNGREVVAQLPDSSGKYEQYVAIIRNIAMK